MGKCLKEQRLKREELDGGEGEGGSQRREDAKMRSKQYEQPGELVTLPSGLQYRELLEGSGRAAALGSRCSVRYTVYKLAPGAYFKYSSGGTPVLLFALGYGTEGQNDIGEAYSFVLGDRAALPVAATLGLVGMRVGGRRRILVPPELGWAQAGAPAAVGPPPQTFGAARRLANNRDGPLLFEAELVRVSDGAAAMYDADQYAGVQLGRPYALPTPPQYGGSAAQRPPA